MNYTKKQQAVIDARDCSLLVSAAAGSGKTAVLVERILTRMMDESCPMDVDRLLVVTFTKAAAAEMRMRIGNAIEKKIELLSAQGSEKDAVVKHLQKQATLLPHASICTIDSFCQNVLRNYFAEAGIEPGFRIADENEIRLLIEDICADLLEQEYQSGDVAFLETAAIFEGKGNRLEDVLLEIRRAALSEPFPEEFLHSCVQLYHLESEDALKTHPVYAALMHAAHQKITLAMQKMQMALQLSQDYDGPQYLTAHLQGAVLQLEDLLHIQEFDALGEASRGFKLATLPRVKTGDMVGEEHKTKRVKKLREAAKTCVNEDVGKKFFCCTLHEIHQILTACSPVADTLVRLVLTLEQAISNEKRERNILDFSDLEHLTLQLFVANENGQFHATDIAKEYRRVFDEIMIDEYQDSNMVQELILSAISGEEEGRFNRFMVGDVKQSIYRFRMARPDLFLDKCKRYTADTGIERKIELDQNFRSRKEVLDVVNAIFSQIMQEETGGIAYDAAASLKYGAESYDTLPAPSDVAKHSYLAELHLLQPAAAGKKEKDEMEARLVATRIKELVGKFVISEKYTDADSGTEGIRGRYCSYKDIVVLMRSGGAFDIYKRVFEQEGIPAYITTRSGYFTASEVRTVLNYLKVLNNPREEIPLYGALTSAFGGLEAQDVAMLKVEHHLNLWDALSTYVQGGEDTELRQKVRRFMEQVCRHRDMSIYMPMHELISAILDESQYAVYVSAMPAGEKRRANLNALITQAKSYGETSYHGLFHFLRYIEHLKKYEIDFGEADVSDENADLVRMMTIHKSKGLEFPICIVAGLGKAMNTAEEKKQVLVHHAYGLGMDYVNLDASMKVRNPIRKLFAAMERAELLGEELRVLYVAMTRAKEKLILTGSIAENPKEIVQVQEAKSLLDFIRYACRQLSPVQMTDDLFVIQDVITIYYVNEDALLSSALYQAVDRQMRMQWMDSKDCALPALREKLLHRFAMPYKGSCLAGLYTKTSVSELKHAAIAMLEDEGGMSSEKELFPETMAKEYIPAFVEEKTPGGTVTGNAYHKLMEHMDFTLQGNAKEITSLMKQLVQDGKMSEEESKRIHIDRIARFMSTDIATKMRAASLKKQLYREQPFVLGLSANLLQPEFPENETVLIQGIIDAYLEEEDGIVLLDYKTDRVSAGEELIRRYEVQMEYYTQALEKLTHKKVKDRILYSFALGEEVQVPRKQ